MFLGIDIGTSGVKAIVLDEHGAVVGQGTAALTVQRPEPLWSEQDPDAWWAATTAAVQAIDPAARRSVRGIGLAGQMHARRCSGRMTSRCAPRFCGTTGAASPNARRWRRARTSADRRQYRHARLHRAQAGLGARARAALFGQVVTVLLPKDYVRLRMTGDKASDLSDSAGTLWLDVANRRWSEALLAATGLTEAQMPRLHEGSEVTGTLLPHVAEAWGMGAVPVAAGGGDNAAGAAGVGVVKDGDALLSLGTSGVIFVATREYRTNPAGAVHAFCHCLPDLWHQMSVHLSAASCIDWVARLTGTAGAPELFARAEAAGIGTGPELFLPYLSGRADAA